MSVLILGGLRDLTVISTAVLDSVFIFLMKLFSFNSCVRDIWKSGSLGCIILALVLTADLDLISGLLNLLVVGMPMSDLTLRMYSSSSL